MLLDNFKDIAASLCDFLAKNDKIFLKCEPEIEDFRIPYEGVIVLLGENGSVKFSIPSIHFSTFVGFLTWFIFGGKKTIYSWDVKKLFSYFYFRLPRHYVINVLARLIDVKYGESFLGIEKLCPETFEEAEERAMRIVNSDACWNVHHRLHIPLATKVLPKIETAGITDIKYRGIRYPSYEIEGQAHGRLKCKESFSGSLLTHNLNKEDKECLKSARQDHRLVTFDFRSMEVYVLQWLSHDEVLGKIISSGRDIYSTIFSLFYGARATKENRQFIKDAFLPIVYGIQADSLARKLNVSFEEARELVRFVNKYFSGAMNWLQLHQDKAKNGETVYDFLGRPRSYDKHWIVRNAIVQGPAAAVCLEKLIALHEGLDCEIVASIHDAYVVDSHVKRMDDITSRAINILESPCQILPNLKLKCDLASL